MELLIFILVAIVAAVVWSLRNKESEFYQSGLGAGIGRVSDYGGETLYDGWCSTPEKVANYKKSHTLLMSVFDTMKQEGEASRCLQIYRDKQSGKLSVVDHKNKALTRTPFIFDCGPINIDTYTYQPEKLIYTGATVGGVHTGGFHTEQAHYKQSHISSRNGAVFCNYAKDMPFFLALRVKLCGELLEKAKVDATMSALLDSNGQLVLMNVGGGAAYFESAGMAAHDGRRYDYAALNSKGVSEKALPMETCKKVAEWLTEAVNGAKSPTQKTISVILDRIAGN